MSRFIKQVSRHLLTTAVAAGAALGAVSAQASGALVLGAPAAPMQIGDVFSVSVSGQGFADTVVGGGFDLAFNPAVLQLTGPAVISPSWEFVPAGGSVDNAAGTLRDASFNSFSNPRSGDFAVATLNFRAVGAGSSTLQLAPSSIFVFSDDLGNLLTPQFGSANVAVVPEPGSVAMMLGGLAALLPLVRRRRRN
jgi:hypothetical protein